MPKSTKFIQNLDDIIIIRLIGSLYVSNYIFAGLELRNNSLKSSMKDNISINQTCILRDNLHFSVHHFILLKNKT